MTSKITAVLLVFTEGTEHSLTDIAGRTGLPVSTAHRLISELTSRQLLERTELGRYRAGARLQNIGTAPVGRLPHLTERAPCVLDDLAATTGHRARLGVLQELAVAYIEKAPGPRPATGFSAAATLPAHPTAVGRALLAFAPARTVETTILRGLRAYTPHTVTSPDRFRRALAVTRLTKVAITRWELESDACGIAVPVFGPDGGVVAALELTVPDLSGDLRPTLAALTIAARCLSRELANAPTAASSPLGQPVPLAAGS